MSATAVAAISAVLGIGLQALRTYEELRAAAVAAGEITADHFAAQDAQLEAQVQRLKALLPPGSGTP